jgi:hypothetical protein
MSDDATTSAVRSLLDVVEELCLGLAAGQTPHTEWADIVSKSFAEHRQEIREGVTPIPKQTDRIRQLMRVATAAREFLEALPTGTVKPDTVLHVRFYNLAQALAAWGSTDD